MDNYERAENQGRQKFEEQFGDKYVINFTSGKFDRVDFFLTAKTASQTTYVGDVKNYETRPYAKYDDYMIDYEKLRWISTIAEDENRIPILAAFFSDVDVVWDLRDVDYETPKEVRRVNKDGQHYGEEKEDSMVTYLKIDDAKWIRRK